jgi:hypothetical protein
MNMNIDELKGLLPDYVAGRLTASERKKVDDALPHSPELQKELEFWKQLKAATLAETEYLAEGHLTPEQIVGYVDSADMTTKLAYEKHLQVCDACRNELEVARGALAEDELGVARNGESWSQLLAKYLRPAYVIPVALALAIYLLIKPPPPPSPNYKVALPPLDTTGSQLVTPMKSKGIAYILLRPRIGVRSASSGGERESLLHYDSSKHMVALSLIVQHSAITQGYRVTIASPLGSRLQVSDTATALVRGAEDTVNASVAMSLFKHEEGRWTIRLEEILKPEARGKVEGEIHEYDLRVKKK